MRELAGVDVGKSANAAMHESTGVAADEPAEAAVNKPSDVTDAPIHKLTEAPTDDPTKVAAPAENAEPTLSLLGRPPMRYNSALDTALDTDINCISEAEFFQMTKELYRTLWTQCRPAMRGLVRHHLGLPEREDIVCDIASTRRWLLGGFNVCIPITVQSPARSYRLILRCAMPHKLAERRYPGTVNGKTACEVATYVWIQEKCPDIPIPRLYGFGFSDHRRFTPRGLPSLVRPYRAPTAASAPLRGLAGWLHKFYLPRLADPGSPILLSRYTHHPSLTAAHQLPSAYLLLEDANTRDSQGLDKTWAAQRKEPRRQKNLFRGLAHIVLSLTRVPLPRIGAFCFRDDGTIALTNRPLDCTTAIFENDDTPRVMPRDQTYSTTEPYVADLLRLRSERFLHHPNAVYDECDCRSEMAAWVLVRSLAHGYIRPEQRDGPFLLQLSDLHPGNIFVDEAWNVTRIVDLEWVCALPVERLKVPYWLTGQDIGGLRNEALAEYATVRDTFMAIFEEEESRVSAAHGLSLTNVLRPSWTSGGVWFWQGLASTNGMGTLFEQHLRPRSFKSVLLSSEKLVSTFFSENADDVVRSKVDAYHQYAKELKKVYEAFSEHAFVCKP